MDAQVIVVTGAAGFLGSAVTVNLAAEHSVVAIDRRQPSVALAAAAPTVDWHKVDIADQDALDRVFRETRHKLGRINFVIHLAAFYHFGSDWRSEYQRSNVDGTHNVLESAVQSQARRLIFASSMVAMLPATPGEMLSENSPTADYIPYGKSKALGEEMVKEFSDRLPSIVLRIGGVFSDWCELPPLASLIKLWGANGPLSRLVVGQGNTGHPYLHRHDFIRLLRRCIEKHENLGSHEVFLASQQGAVLHKDLFPIIRAAVGEGKPAEPILTPAVVARMGLAIQLAWGFITRDMPYERLWMLGLRGPAVWIADTLHTRDKLNWDCSSGMGICDRLPQIVDRFVGDRSQWEWRNRVRNEGKYAYLGDD